MTPLLALAEDPSWVPAGFTTAADAAEHMLKLLGALGFAYVLATGLAFRSGTRRGQTVAESRRNANGLPNLKPLPADSDDKPFWKDNALLQGGITGIFIMAILASYVVLMLAFTHPDPAIMPTSIAILMIYPIAMAAFFATLWGLALRQFGGAPIYLLIVVSIVATVLSVVVLFKSRSPVTSITVQFLLCVIQSAVLSYLFGIGRGIALADLESRFPTAIVSTSDGHTRDNLRILQIGPTDCRFIEPDGAITLIPKSKIVSIRTT